jgi:hypothetical protein
VRIRRIRFRHATIVAAAAFRIQNTESRIQKAAGFVELSAPAERLVLDSGF